MTIFVICVGSSLLSKATDVTQYMCIIQQQTEHVKEQFPPPLY